MGKARDLANVGSVASQGLNFRNKIINGACAIDQRNNGASINITSSVNAYNIDRWHHFKQSSAGAYTVQRVSSAPPDFTNSLQVSITSAHASTDFTSAVNALVQFVEGLNVSDLAWGTAQAKPVTLSFWVRSSVVGSYSIAIGNVNYDRQYPTTYTINAANTWEYKTIVVPGDTTGTWAKDNSVGMRVWFDLGTSSDPAYTSTANTWHGSGKFRASGTVQLLANNGATWNITGVQLEKGTQATPFEHRPITMETQLCQRYFQRHGYWGVVGQGQNTDRNSGSYVAFPVPMRTAPTTASRQMDVDIGDLNVAFTPIIYSDPIGNGVGFRIYRNSSTSVTRGDTMDLIGSDPFPFNAEL